MEGAFVLLLLLLLFDVTMSASDQILGLVMLLLVTVLEESLLGVSRGDEVLRGEFMGPVVEEVVEEEEIEEGAKAWLGRRPGRPSAGAEVIVGRVILCAMLVG